MEINRDLEVPAVPVAVGHFLDRLDLGIEPFANCVRDAMLEVRQNLGQVFAEHPRLFNHRFL